MKRDQEEVAFSRVGELFTGIEQNDDYAILIQDGTVILCKSISEDERAPFMELEYNIHDEWVAKRVYPDTSDDLRSVAERIVRADLPVDTDEQWEDSVGWVLSLLKDVWEDGESESVRVPRIK